MHDVGVDTVAARRERRYGRVEIERLRRPRERMKVRDCVQRLAHEEQVHQFAVIGQQCVVAARRQRRPGPPRITDRQRELRGRGGKVRFRRERSI